MSDDRPTGTDPATTWEGSTLPVPSVPGRRVSRRERASAWRELARFLPDVGRLLVNVAKDDRVPWHAKVAALGAVAYVASPVDLLPDVIGRTGLLDDVFVVTKALRYLVKQAGYEVVHELWEGSDDGFALLLMVAGIER